jgi:hypothetical protein
VTDFTSNPNWEQFDNRAVPFNGDYLWITSFGNFSFGTWTDYRNTVAGLDAREGGDSDNDSADVKQCRTVDASGAVGPDTCPHDGGLDQNIYGSRPDAELKKLRGKHSFNSQPLSDSKRRTQ